ncbi:hypothetical protein Hdeb2414_s0001g00033161 [Helianthus debilis subsp. tardiflorus]
MMMQRRCIAGSSRRRCRSRRRQWKKWRWCSFQVPVQVMGLSISVLVLSFEFGSGFSYIGLSCPMTMVFRRPPPLISDHPRCRTHHRSHKPTDFHLPPTISD